MHQWKRKCAPLALGVGVDAHVAPNQSPRGAQSAGNGPSLTHRLAAQGQLRLARRLCRLRRLPLGCHQQALLLLNLRLWWGGKQRLRAFVSTGMQMQGSMAYMHATFGPHLGHIAEHRFSSPQMALKPFLRPRITIARCTACSAPLQRQLTSFCASTSSALADLSSPCQERKG